jgi:hypothetical protein
MRPVSFSPCERSHRQCGAKVKRPFTIAAFQIGQQPARTAIMYNCSPVGLTAMFRPTVRAVRGGEGFIGAVAHMAGLVRLCVWETVPGCIGYGLRRDAEESQYFSFGIFAALYRRCVLEYVIPRLAVAVGAVVKIGGRYGERRLRVFHRQTSLQLNSHGPMCP